MADIDDPTVAYPGDQPVPEALPILEQDPANGSVGPKNIPGYERVVALADFLVGLKDSLDALTNQQAAHIIALWKILTEYDQKPIANCLLPSRHQTKLVQVRFKVAKKSNVIPEVDSTKRCFLGQNCGPASWPDCNRNMEAVIIKLCQIYPSPLKKN